MDEPSTTATTAATGTTPTAAARRPNVPRPIGYEPTVIAPETFLIRTALASKADVMTVYQSSMVIRGAQPILVDTGPAAAGDQWLDTVFGLVDPTDVRWVFVSHNDSDHDGNLLNVLAACPRATLVTTSPAVARMSSSFDLPYRRMSWLRIGETFDAGDRTIEIIDPPVYDSPVTHGLFDRSTRAMWAVDSFASVIPTVDPPTFARDLPQPEWEGALSTLGIGGSPWLEGVRSEWFAARLRTVTDRQPSVVASAHGAALDGAQIDRAVELYAALPGTTPPADPGEDALRALLAAHP
jgi:hypothetical protein